MPNPPIPPDPDHCEKCGKVIGTRAIDWFFCGMFAGIGTIELVFGEPYGWFSLMVAAVVAAKTCAERGSATSISQRCRHIR